MKAFYAPDTDYYYEHIKPGAENHIEVPFRPSKDYQLDLGKIEWYLPAEVIEQRAKDLAKSDLENIDKTSVSALREAVIALINGEVVSEKTKDILMVKEVEAIGLSTTIDKKNSDTTKTN